MRTDKEMKWEVLKTEHLFNHPWLNVTREKVRLPNGMVYDDYYILHYPTFANIIAITKEGKIILERQYRHAMGLVSTELVAGCIEKDETPLEGAQRELLEETGFTGGRWTELMVIAPNSGAADNLCYCFVADGVEKTSCTHLDRTEDIEVFFKSKEEVFEMLKRGDFMQAMMVAPLWKYFSECNK